MATMVERTCCKAHAREKKLDRFDFKHGGERRDFGASSMRLDGIDYEGGGWDAHKGVF